MTLVELSDRNCHRCGKRMVTEVDPYFMGPGTKWLLDCWDCGWKDFEIVPSKPTLRVVHGGRTGADRLKAVRLGDAG